jgi:molybdate transport system ATP-binding protein
MDMPTSGATAPAAAPHDLRATADGRDAKAGIDARFRVERDAFTLDVDLRLPGRGVTALFGQSGSGKTTCLRCMAGLEKPRSGYLRVNGELWLDTSSKVAVPTHRRALGYVFQEASLFPHLSVLGNLRFGLKRIPVAQRKVDLEQAAVLLGIDHLLARMPSGLSGGERQRVGVARALLASPRLLLMDEPLAALDEARKREILPYLERLHDELDIPVLYVSHSTEEVARLADHLVVLEGGRVLASGPIADTLARLDLPLALADDASVLVDGTVDDYDDAYRLLTVLLPGSTSSLRVVHAQVTRGQRLRLVIKARDVSLALRRQTDGSILNALPARVVDIKRTGNPAHVSVRLDADGTPLLARITRYSCDQLGLIAGAHVWAQIKSVSLLP